MKDGLDLSNVNDKSQYIKSVLDEVSKETDEIKREFILQKISTEFDVDVNILKNNLKKQEKYSKIETLSKKPEKKEKIDKYTKATYGILYAMMNSYEKTKTYEKKLNYSFIISYPPRKIFLFAARPDCRKAQRSSRPFPGPGAFCASRTESRVFTVRLSY